MKGTGLPIGKPVLLLIRPLFRKNLVLTEHEVMGPELTQAEVLHNFLVIHSLNAPTVLKYYITGSCNP